MRLRILEPLALAGLVAISVAVSVLVWRWSPIRAGHPSYLIFYSVVILLGVGGVTMVLRRQVPQRGARSTFGAMGLVVLGFAAWWLSPFPADRVAVAALVDPEGYRVTESASSIVLEPDAARSGVSLTFYPGARIDARAYGHILGPLARGGHEVTIIKPPVGIALLVFGVTRPENTVTWVVGGHSLGGVAASEVDDGAEGLLLWASFPASDNSGRTGTEVTSIYGTADTFATSSDVAASVSNLPEETVFVAVEGGIHSFFGDYGIQPGDGEPSISRDEAQGQIVTASLELLRRAGGR
jgi:hypothetical protein